MKIRANHFWMTLLLLVNVRILMTCVRCWQVAIEILQPGGCLVELQMSYHLPGYVIATAGLVALIAWG